MFLHVQQTILATALITAPSVLAIALWALTSQFLLALINIFARANTITSESRWTFTAMCVLIHTSRVSPATTSILPTSSIVNFTAEESRSFTMNITITNKLDSLHCRTFTDSASEGVPACSKIGMLILPASSIVLQAFICFYIWG
uniref:Uncharacterized protein n=1 Tax=Opuntia streptacantha TaxID=393608 RepID=A0A7C9E801_OPUST